MTFMFHFLHSLSKHISEVRNNCLLAACFLSPSAQAASTSVNDKNARDERSPGREDGRGVRAQAPPQRAHTSPSHPRTETGGSLAGPSL